MEELFPVLKNCVLFENIRQEDLKGLLDCLGAVVRQVPKENMVISEGDDADCVGVVLSGAVRIWQEDYYGNRTILGQVLPGELFGESFACAGIPAVPVSVVATEDSRVMWIPCRRIMTGCQNACGFHSQILYNLIRVIAAKNLAFHGKIRILSKRTTREKLMTYLLEQAKLAGADTFTIPYDRQALADYLCVERSAMSAEIGKLRKEGVLDCRKNRFQLLKTQNL